jgi:hypothetical protein
MLFDADQRRSGKRVFAEIDGGSIAILGNHINPTVFHLRPSAFICGEAFLVLPRLRGEPLSPNPA